LTAPLRIFPGLRRSRAAS